MKRNPYSIEIKVHLDREVYERAKKIAYKLSLPVKGWIAYMIAKQTLQWRDPATGRRRATKVEEDPKAQGKWCVVCNVKAKGCRNPVMHENSMWNTVA